MGPISQTATLCDLTNTIIKERQIFRVIKFVFIPYVRNIIFRYLVNFKRI